MEEEIKNKASKEELNQLQLQLKQQMEEADKMREEQAI